MATKNITGQGATLQEAYNRLETAVAVYNRRLTDAGVPAMGAPTTISHYITHGDSGICQGASGVSALELPPSIEKIVEIHSPVSSIKLTATYALTAEQSSHERPASTPSYGERPDSHIIGKLL